jgi:hypothetical protein
MTQLSFQRKPEGFNIPDDTQRIVIVGTTGSGKTHAGLWHLARRNYDEKPWIVYNWKRDPFINSIEGTFRLSVDAPAPERPGIYIVEPRPKRDDEAVETQMFDIWEKEDIGVFVDEGFLIAPSNDGFTDLLIQGRSKHIPMIICTQRPVWMDKYVFTESEFKQVFRLQSKDDMKKMEEYVPDIMSIAKLHPLAGRENRYWSYYYDAPEDKLNRMPPMPDAETIHSIFRAKLSNLKEVL